MLANKNASSKKADDQRNLDNSAKTLLANIRFMSVDNPIRTIVITSSIPNEGKTFVVTNLGRAMATSGVKTLLVESDMRRRSLAHNIHVHAQHGLYSVVSGEVKLMDAVVPTDTDRLYMLDAEPHIPNPSDLLSSRRFSALIEEAKHEFGYIVFDTPPVGTFVDAAVVGAKVDALFMVVREQFTRKDVVARATEQLKQGKVPLSGIVMNYCARDSSDYYYYDYYYREDTGKGKGRYRGPQLVQTPAEQGAQRVQRVQQPMHAYAPGSTASSNPYTAEYTGQPSEPARAPRSWNNAPNLDDSESYADDRAEETHESWTQPTPEYANETRPAGRSPRFKVPSIGDTNMLSIDELNARNNQQRIATDAIDQG